MFKIFVTTPMPRDVLMGFFSGNDVDLVINEELPLPREKFLHSIQGVDAIIIQPWITINKEALDAAGPNLKV
jgi:hypothetical protein